MTDETRAALIGGLLGFLSACVPLLFAYVTALTEQRAMEAGKQSEAVRMEASRAVGAVMKSLGRVSDLLRSNIELESKIPSSSEAIIARLRDPLRDEGAAMLDAYLGAQIYLDLTVGQEILALRHKLERLTIR